MIKTPVQRHQTVNRVVRQPDTVKHPPWRIDILPGLKAGDSYRAAHGRSWVRLPSLAPAPFLPAG
jgi:hypothetical protein